jgi:predicted nucleotidyltransferase
MFDEDVIAEAARRLSAAAPGAQIILFGSHARGDAGPDSDLDFLVVEPAVEDVVAESVRLRRTLRGLGLFADIVVVSVARRARQFDSRGAFGWSRNGGLMAPGDLPRVLLGLAALGLDEALVTGRVRCGSGCGPPSPLVAELLP